MIKNYFKSALRNLKKNAVFSLINLSGLSIGISSALVIYLIVSFDLGFDKFEKDKERIYRIVSDFTFSGESYHNYGVTYPMANALSREATGVSVVAPLYTWSERKISVQGLLKEPAVFKKQQNI